MVLGNCSYKRKYWGKRGGFYFRFDYILFKIIILKDLVGHFFLGVDRFLSHRPEKDIYNEGSNNGSNTEIKNPIER